MIPIIEENRRPSQSLSEGLSQGLSVFQKYQEMSRQKERMREENEASKRLGIDLSGFVDPDLRKAALVEHMKQQGKQSLLQQKQSYLDQILGGNKNKDQSPPQTPQTGQSAGFDPLQLSDEDIIRAEALGIDGLRASKDAALRKQENIEKEKQTKFQSDREYHSKVSQPIIDQAQSILKQAPIKKGLLAQQRRDIASGNTEGIIPFMVEQTGAEFWRNPESARFKTASKQRFVETLHELGGANARPNQFIEQQLVSAQPTLGRDAESNLSVMDLEEFVEDMKIKRAELELKLADEDIEKYGYAKNDISRRADKMMPDYAEERQEKMAYDIRKRYEDKLTDEQLAQQIVGNKVVEGTPLTVRTARILMIKNNDDEKAAQAEAKRLGFTLPREQNFKRP